MFIGAIFGMYTNQPGEAAILIECGSPYHLRFGKSIGTLKLVHKNIPIYYRCRVDVDVDFAGCRVRGCCRYP